MRKLFIILILFFFFLISVAMNALATQANNEYQETVCPYANSGDVDSDGMVAPDDASDALLIYLDLYVENLECAEENADLCPAGGDGVVDPGDATGILKKYLNVIPYCDINCEVEITPSEYTLCSPGSGVSYVILTAEPCNSALIWATTDPSIAMVTAQSGSTATVTAISPGACTIGVGCSDGSGCGDTCDITVINCSSDCDIVVSPATLSLCTPGTGENSGTLTASSCTGLVTWESTNVTVATVWPISGNATTVTASGAGSCNIIGHCSAGSDCQDICSVTVTNCGPDCLIDIWPPSLSLCGPGTGSTTTGGLISSGCSGGVIWESSNILVGTVHPASGATTTVTAKGLGNCNISAHCTAGSGCDDSVGLTVYDCSKR